MKKLLLTLLAAIAVLAYADETEVAGSDITSNQFVITDYLLVKEYFRGPVWEWLFELIDRDLVISTLYNTEIQLDAGGVSTSEIPNGVIRLGHSTGGDMLINYSPMYVLDGPLVLGVYGDSAYYYDTVDSTFNSEVRFGCVIDTNGVTTAETDFAVLLQPGQWYDHFTFNLRRVSGAGYDTSLDVSARIVCTNDALQTILNWSAPWGVSYTTATITGTSFAEYTFTPSYPIYVPMPSDHVDLYLLALTVYQDTAFTQCTAAAEFEDSVDWGGPPVFELVDDVATSAPADSFVFHFGECGIHAGMLEMTAILEGSLSAGSLHAGNGATDTLVVGTDSVAIVDGIIVGIF